MKNVQVVLYMVSLTDYDQILPEDQKNVLEESIEIFRVTCNGEWFKETPILLVFNKYDTYEKNFQKKIFKKNFPNFEGDTIEDSLEFLQKIFLNDIKHKNVEHITCSLKEKGSIYYILEMINKFGKFEYVSPRNQSPVTPETDKVKVNQQFNDVVVIGNDE